MKEKVSGMSRGNVIAADAMPYPLDNHAPQAVGYHALLGQLWDGWSVARLKDLFGEPRETMAGLRCWEVGAGVGGQFAVWLAGRVGRDGFVLATDRQVRDIPALANLAVVEHDLTGDREYPGWPGGFDLIHVRLVLQYLPQRRRILSRLADRLAPGGWLLVEDWVTTPAVEMVVSSVSEQDAALYVRVQQALSNVFAEAGTDHSWGGQVYPALLAEDLTTVGTQMCGQVWPAGGPGCRLVAGTIAQARDRLRAAGITVKELDRVGELLTRDDPGFALAGHLMHSTSGCRPPG
ncbi:methyltransferase domain-containing protein [Phytohabitans sp. ZYX-F-186]|uniref:Methyltransferase domain-containing protein n=1 Tax=Phytohabitans maris TaxID=3071409 RepID=A0ABU0ZFE5_9ACTN|nr:methyltransferase domain-containing protein [Phytohabitans sp. ZYX-F-186]MDQ7904672.1 methyltransferase domain-containing protein [Phytohabitans sp. ZYX-F-186]